MSAPLKRLFSNPKPIIGMVHVPALPGSAGYDAGRGMSAIREAARRDALILQDHGLDAVLFCNEHDRPYGFRVSPATVAGMADVVGRVADDLRIPYGVDILWDPASAVSVAIATGARFVREVFTGVYASDMGLWQPGFHEVSRLLRECGSPEIQLFANIAPEFCGSLDSRPLAMVARSVVTSCRFEVLLVSGATAGMEANAESIAAIKRDLPDVAVLANTGVRAETVGKYLGVADGAIVGTCFKRDGVTWNEVEPARVARFMDAVRRLRASL